MVPKLHLQQHFPGQMSSLRVYNSYPIILHSNLQKQKGRHFDDNNSTSQHKQTYDVPTNYVIYKSNTNYFICLQILTIVCFRAKMNFTLFCTYYKQMIYLLVEIKTCSTCKSNKCFFSWCMFVCRWHNVLFS